MGSFSDNFRIVFGSFSDHFRIILGSLRDHFGSLDTDTDFNVTAHVSTVHVALCVDFGTVEAGYYASPLLWNASRVTAEKHSESIMSCSLLPAPEMKYNI